MVMGGQRHAPAALPPGKTRYPLYRRVDMPQGQSGRFRNIPPKPGFDPRTFQPVANRYTDWTIASKHTHTHTTKTVREISSFALIKPTYRLTQSMCTGLRKQFYAQQEVNVNWFGKAVRYSLGQSYKSIADGRTCLYHGCLLCRIRLHFSMFRWLVPLDITWLTIKTRLWISFDRATFNTNSPPGRQQQTSTVECFRLHSFRRPYLYTSNPQVTDFIGLGGEGKKDLPSLPSLVVTPHWQRRPFSLGDLATPVSNPTSKSKISSDLLVLQSLWGKGEVNTGLWWGNLR